MKTRTPCLAARLGDGLMTTPTTAIGSIPLEASLPKTSPDAPTTGASAGREEWDLAIGGMHCASCVARVEGALGGVSGVQDARVNLATQRATVTVDPSRTDLDQLV